MKIFFMKPGRLRSRSRSMRIVMRGPSRSMRMTMFFSPTASARRLRKSGSVTSVNISSTERA